MPSSTATPRSSPPREVILSPARTVVLTVAGAALIGACYGFARFAYGLFLPTFRGAFGLDGAAAGLIASLSYLAYCLGIVGATAATPRLGPRTTAAAAAAVASIGCALIAAAPSTPFFAAGVAIAGASTGMASPPLAQAIATVVRASARDRVQTIVNAGTGAGVMVAGPIALVAQEHWRMAWAGFAVASALMGAGIVIAIPRTRQDRPDRQNRLRHPRRFPSGSVRLGIAAVTMGAGSAAGWTFGQDLLHSDGGHGPAVTTGAWIALGACGLLGALAGDLVARTSLRVAWRVLMLAFAGVLLLWTLLVDSAVVAVLASAAFGALYIALTGVLLVWSTRLHPDRPSTGVGQAFLAIALGQAAASWLLGIAADAWGMPTAFLLAAGITLAGILAAPRSEP